MQLVHAPTSHAPLRSLVEIDNIPDMPDEHDPLTLDVSRDPTRVRLKNRVFPGLIALFQPPIVLGERILPEGFVDFVSTVAPDWVADGRPIYGGFFWINLTQRFPIPKEAYYMAGAGGQFTIIIPSHDLVVFVWGTTKGADQVKQHCARH